MNSIIRNRMKSISALTSISFVVFIAMLSPCVWGYSPEMRREFLKGPWEIVVKMEADGTELHYPVTVSDANKSEKLEDRLLVMGSPFEVQLRQYVPNLRWENIVTEQREGGIVASIAIEGSNMKQNMFLDSTNPKRQSMSSRIGGVTIKEIRNSYILLNLVQGI